MVSWLPLYHDMGLITLLMGIANQGSLYLMRPDQFIRDPMRWIRAMSGRQHSVCPSFGIDYAARRLSPEDIEGVDLTSWKSLATGAECIDLTALHASPDWSNRRGSTPQALIAAYGLAERPHCWSPEPLLTNRSAPFASTSHHCGPGSR